MRVAFQPIAVDGCITNGDDMRKISLASPLRYGIALLSVILATTIRLALYPLLGDRFPFLTFFVAIVFTAWYGGFGPSLMALVLSWWSVDYFLLQRRGSLPIFEPNSQIAYPFFALGLTVILLVESVRAAQRRAKASASEARRALECQQAHREWLRITLASIADAVITTDSEGRVTSLNPVAERLTGWGAPEAVGRPLEEVFRTVEEATNRATDLPVAKVVRGGEVVLLGDHMVLIARDGAAKFVEHNAAPIKDDQGKITGVIIIFRDITERRRAEEALRESEERFRQLAEHITDVFWMADPHLSQTLYVSPAYEAIWGYSCRSLYERPRSFLEAVHPEDRDRLLVALGRQAQGQATAEEYRIVRPDGSVRWIWDRGFPIEDETGEVVRVAGIAEDITDRRRAEEEVRHQTQILKTITDNADSALVMLDVQGHCTFINPAFTRLTGYTEDDIRGRPVHDAVHDKYPNGRALPHRRVPHRQFLLETQAHPRARGHLRA